MTKVQVRKENKYSLLGTKEELVSVGLEATANVDKVDSRQDRWCVRRSEAACFPVPEAISARLVSNIGKDGAQGKRREDARSSLGTSSTSRQPGSAQLSLLDLEGGTDGRFASATGCVARRNNCSAFKSSFSRISSFRSLLNGML